MAAAASAITIILLSSANFINAYYLTRESKLSKRIMKVGGQSPFKGSWEVLESAVLESKTGTFLREQEMLRSIGEGLPHTDAKIRLFGTKEEPRVTFYRDTAAWCPYCQKVWILLEEKKIPYRVEKINMRSYGDKPAAFLRVVPNGLLPAISIDGKLQTESLEIMLNLERSFAGPGHAKMWPAEGDADYPRAARLMRLERALFSQWCDLVFRPSFGGGARKRFEEGLDAVESELSVCAGPWFLPYLSIVDLTYVTHVERMCASVAYWCGFKLRGEGRWPGIERWLSAFEERSSYRATKSDYYTHVMDIPPQYGPSYPVFGWEKMAGVINGKGDLTWKVPLPPLSPTDIEPVSAALNPGDEAARHEAAYKILVNHEAIVKFALRGAGSPGSKQFQAPLADPYAVPNLTYTEEMDEILKSVVFALVYGVDHMTDSGSGGGSSSSSSGGKGSYSKQVRGDLIKCIGYLRDRIGVPRDMSYPAARQLRAHLNWAVDNLV